MTHEEQAAKLLHHAFHVTNHAQANRTYLPPALAYLRLAQRYAAKTLRDRQLSAYLPLLLARLNPGQTASLSKDEARALNPWDEKENVA